MECLWSADDAHGVDFFPLGGDLAESWDQLVTGVAESVRTDILAWAARLILAEGVASLLGWGVAGLAGSFPREGVGAAVHILFEVL